MAAIEQSDQEAAGILIAEYTKTLALEAAVARMERARAVLDEWCETSDVSALSSAVRAALDGEDGA